MPKILINLKGVEVDVPDNMVEGLLAQGFTEKPAPKAKESKKEAK